MRALCQTGLVLLLLALNACAAATGLYLIQRPDPTTDSSSATESTASDPLPRRD